MKKQPRFPLFSGLNERAAGVWMHVSSLPGPYGIGQFGSCACEFIDRISDAGLSVWQVCPLGPTGYGDSPYQTFSSFALNPYFIDPNELVGMELLKADDLNPIRSLPENRVDYGALYYKFWPILKHAAKTFLNNPQFYKHYGSWENFYQNHRDWLRPYSFFMAFKEHFKGLPWWEWPPEYRSWHTVKQTRLYPKIEQHASEHAALMYFAFGQWEAVHRYATKKGVTLFGDVPIFVAKDSADLWSNPHLFEINPETHLPASQAGVPPDFYSKTGQLWGNPLYDWNQHKEERFDWWKRRLEVSFTLFDWIRLDHFIGFSACWRVEQDALTARDGIKVHGPGIAFFEAIAKAIPNAKLIAEDLGDITDSVRELLTKTGLPGMAVLQFAFGDKSSNEYLPHNLRRNTVLYTSTHDCNTATGWYDSSPEKTQDHVRRYLQVNGHDIAWDLIRSAYQSVATWSIVGMTDFLNLGPDARFNTPSKPDGNWTWRITRSQMEDFRERSRYLHELGQLYGRCE
jgi:4-alpha-glucanotransferase